MDIIPKRIRFSGSATEKGKTMDDDGADSCGVDRISNLPSDILCHILSFLPTKYAVGTCILSTKWKNLFRLVPNLTLELDDSLFLHPESASITSLISFMNFGNRLLNVTLCDVPSIDFIRIICRTFNDGKEIGDWISAALRLNVKRIDLRTRYLMNSNFLFDSLYGCNIVSLHLLLDLGDDAPECRFNLPNLTMLLVQYTKFKVVNVLLECCPVVEYMVIYNCICSPGEKLRICIPSLKALKLVNGLYNGGFEIELDAPKLEYLCYDGFLASRYLVQRLKSLQIAYFDLDEMGDLYQSVPNEPAMELVKACFGAEKMCFSDIFIRILHRCPRPLPIFPKLVVLMIKFIDSHGWELLPSFLNSAPNLKLIILREGFDNECYESFKASLKKPLSVCLSERDKSVFYLRVHRKVEN